MSKGKRLFSAELTVDTINVEKSITFTQSAPPGESVVVDAISITLPVDMSLYVSTKPNTTTPADGQGEFQRIYVPSGVNNWTINWYSDTVYYSSPDGVGQFYITTWDG